MEQDYIVKCQCYIHSLKQGEKHVMDEAVIIKKIGDNDYLAQYGDVKCHAIYNPYKSAYFVDDKFGVISEKSGTEKGVER